MSNFITSMLNLIIYFKRNLESMIAIGYLLN
jgi:hypothetical protein